MARARATLSPTELRVGEFMAGPNRSFPRPHAKAVAYHSRGGLQAVMAVHLAPLALTSMRETGYPATLRS